MREREQQQFEEAEAAIKEAIEKSPELSDVAESIKVDSTPEGLRIQLIDQERVALFPNGSAAMYEQTRKLLVKVAEVVAALPNKIEITGHTDSKQFSPGSTYTNWDLSSDRANASRRVMVANWIDEKRIDEVVGKADREPLVADPSDPTNRRISIILKHLNSSDTGAMKAAEAEAQRRAAQAAGAPQGTGNPAAPAAAPVPRADDRGGPIAPPRVGG